MDCTMFRFGRVQSVIRGITIYTKVTYLGKQGPYRSVHMQCHNKYDYFYNLSHSYKSLHKSAVRPSSQRGKTRTLLFKTNSKL